MPEPIAAWWRRRQFSTGRTEPYPVGRYRRDWERFPALIRQYHPEFNDGRVLSQIPPAADVWLQWQCEVGHLFIATPAEQRARPTGERRRSVWCPECTLEAKPRVVPMRTAVPTGGSAPTAAPWVDARGPASGGTPARTPASTGTRARARSRAAPPCPRTPDLPPGTAFRSECAPAPASAVEAELRAGLAALLPFDTTHNAVRLRQPFFDHLEAWPDLVLDDLRVAIEYDSTGRHGLEHVGPRERIDARKDALLRRTGWEVVRIRTGRLHPLGPHDLCVGGLSAGLYARLLDELRVIRGALIVDAYLTG